MKNVTDPNETSARLIAKKSRVNRGNTPASQLKCILKDADGVGVAAPKVAGSVVEECDICAAFDEAPHLPVAGSLLVSALDPFSWFGDAPCPGSVSPQLDAGTGILKEPA